MNNRIVGRKKELKELKDIFNSKKSEFVTVLGRRRVGKTYLIRNFFQNNGCIFFQVIGLQNGSLEQQLENFTESLSETFYNKLPMKSAANWKEAFQWLTTAIEKETRKIVLFFDELPWIATPRSDLLSNLEYFWNKYWVDMPNLKLFVCGSIVSWIIKKILNNKGGLHNRSTRKMVISHFSLGETKDYLNAMGCKFNDDQVLEIYMAMGGIPFYLNGIKKNLSANQNINNLCFRKEGLLFDEFDNLFKSLFNDAEAYIELVRLIAKNRYGISRKEIEDQAKLSKKGGTLTERLKDLEEAGFILTILPTGYKSRGIYYKIIDEFSLFFLIWIEPEKNTFLKIESNGNFWKQKCNSPDYNSWSGYAFEAVCYKHISNIRKALDIPEGSTATAWRYSPTKNEADQGSQIDLLFDRKDGVITICEIKFTDEPFTIKKPYAKNLICKKEIFTKKMKTNKQLFLVLISAHGLKENIYSEDLISDVVTLEALFKA